MGLDMYLYARKFNSSFRKGSLEIKYPCELQGFENLMKDSEESLVIKTDYKIGYWRKFNALHHFIVKHFNEGKDDCKPIWLNDNAINYILNTLKTVKKSFENANIIVQTENYIIYDNPIAQQLLPTKDGCLFGNLDYDSEYLDNLNNAIYTFEMVSKLSIKEPYYDFYYQASW